MDRDAGPFLIGISVSHVSMGTQEFFLPKKVHFIAFKTACSSKNLIHT